MLSGIEKSCLLSQPSACPPFPADFLFCNTSAKKFWVYAFCCCCFAFSLLAPPSTPPPLLFSPLFLFHKLLLERIFLLCQIFPHHHSLQDFLGALLPTRGLCASTSPGTVALGGGGSIPCHLCHSPFALPPWPFLTCGSSAINSWPRLSPPPKTGLTHSPRSPRQGAGAAPARGLASGEHRPSRLGTGPCSSFCLPQLYLGGTILPQEFSARNLWWLVAQKYAEEKFIFFC